MSSLYSELRTVLAERAKPETQFNIFKSVHKEAIAKLIADYGCPEEDVLTTIYLSKFIMTGDVTSHTGRQQTLTDDQRVEMILKNLLEGQKHLPEIPLQKHLFLLQLTWQIAWEADKVFQRNMLDNSFPMSLLFCRVIDNLLIPLISEWNRVLSELTEEPIDFQWVFAEILAALLNDFPLETITAIKEKVLVSDLESSEYFFGGWVICQEYLQFLRLNEYAPVVFPDATNLHLTDTLTMTGILFYKDSTKEILTTSDSNLITSDGVFTLQDDESTVLKNLVLLDHPAVAKAGIPLKNAKYRIEIDITEGTSSSRYLFFHNTKDKINDLGIWVFFLMQAEEINFTLLELILQTRLSQVYSIIDQFKDDSESLNLSDTRKTRFRLNWEEIYQGWLKSLIVDLQEGSIYTDHLRDTQKAQKYLPVAFAEAKYSEPEGVLYFDAADADKRLFQKSSDLFVNELKNLYSLADLNFLSGINLLKIALKGCNKEFTALSGSILEFLFYVAEKPDEQFLLLPHVILDKDHIPEARVISFIAMNEKIGDIFHKKMAFQPRRNLQRLLRIVAETRGRKLLKDIVRDRLDQVFSQRIRDIKVDTMWRNFFKSLESLDDALNAERSKIQDDVLSHEDQIQADHLKLKNNVAYYIIKDLIIMGKLLQIEKSSLETIIPLSIEANQSSNKAVKSITRRIESYLNKLDELPDLLKEFIKTLHEEELTQNLPAYLDQKKSQVLDKLQDLSSSELQDITFN